MVRSRLGEGTAGQNPENGANDDTRVVSVHTMESLGGTVIFSLTKKNACEVLKKKDGEKIKSSAKK